MHKSKFSLSCAGFSMTIFFLVWLGMPKSSPEPWFEPNLWELDQKFGPKFNFFLNQTKSSVQGSASWEKFKLSSNWYYGWEILCCFDGICLIQWLKKLLQCLHVFERFNHYSMITQSIIINIFLRRLGHLGFPTQVRPCNYNQNSLFCKPNKMATHWSSFLSLHYSTIYYFLIICMPSLCPNNCLYPSRHAFY